nr:hypothetical protein GCM10020241_32320 [Streptoalloteichus tenebrarius]
MRTQPEKTERRSGWLRSRAVRWLSAVAAVSALVAGGLVAQTTLMGENPPGATASAAELLNRAADAAIKAKDQEVKPGQFRYLRTTAWHSTTVQVKKTGASGDQRSGAKPLDWVTYLEKGVIEYWIPADFHGEWLMRRTWNAERKFFRPEDEAALREGMGRSQPSLIEVRRAKGGQFYRGEPAFKEMPDGKLVPLPEGKKEDPTPRQGDGGWADPTPEFFAKLPRDPQQLLDKIYQDSQGKGPGPDEEAFVYVRDVLRTGRVPADLRAALFRAAAKIPGMRIVDDAANLEGRKGIAVSRGDGATRNDLIFDPETGDVIGERGVATKAEGNVPVGAVTSWTAIVSSVVNTMGEKTGS